MMKKILTVLLLVVLAASAHAKTYKIIVGTTPGNPGDTLTRKLFDEVSKETGDTFVVVNRPGAGFMVAYKSFLDESRHTPDMILFTITSIYGTKINLEVDPSKDLKSLIAAARVPPYVLISKKGSQFKSFADVRKVNIGHSSSISNFLTEKYFPPDTVYQQVLYKTESDAIFALLKGEVEMTITSGLNAKPFEDQLNYVTTFPKEVSAVMGFCVAKTFPEDEKDKLNRVINKTLKSSELHKWTKDTLPLELLGGSPDHYDYLVESYKKLMFSK